jgi:ubiquinone/menaquinone biosynthesis C-methylase UbiE
VSTPALLDHLAALTDPVRCRILLLLEQDEAMVAELCTALQLPQSTVSRHLKLLLDEGWVTSRADGTIRWYRMAIEEMPDGSAQLWAVVRGDIAASAEAREDARRHKGAVARRRSRSQEFFESSAGRWDDVRTQLFGDRADLVAFLSLLDERWTVGDLGCGTGQVSSHIAPFVRQVIAVDESDAMLAEAKFRLRGAANVDLRQGSLEQLPLLGGSLDAAFLFLVLHHLADPSAAIKEAARTLRPGGKLMVVEMQPHARAEYQRTMGHRWLGFEEGTMRKWFDAAGLDRFRTVPLPPDPTAKGPTLFVATGINA